MRTLIVPAKDRLCLPSDLERYRLTRYRLVAPRVKEGPGWAALATTKRRNFVIDEPVNLSKETVVSFVKDELERLNRRPLFPKTCLSDDPVGLSRGHRKPLVSGGHYA